MNILAMTVCCVDVYPGTGDIYVGGNALNFAVQCVKSGADETAILGAIGNDRYGELIWRYLMTKPIDISHLHHKEGRTASNTIYINENNDRYFRPDSWDGGVYANYRLTREDIDFMNSFYIVATTSIEPNLQTICRYRKNFRLTLDYLDTRDYSLMDEMLPQTEISFISGDKDVIGRVKPLSVKHDALIVVTLGTEGSYAVYQGKEYIQKAEAVEKIVDTTGCGDAYQAAFTVSYFLYGDIKTAMKRGSEAAARVLNHYGGVD